MTAPLLVLVPVLGRPHRVRPTLDSICATVPAARVLFIADPTDGPELAELADAGAEVLQHGGSYATKINVAIAATRSTGIPHIFLGADDLVWTPGWYAAAAAHLAAGASVVGVNDLCSARSRAGTHATHFLITREYAELPTADGGRGPLHEGYDHSCVDDELVATARHRGALVIDTSIVVEHLHPDARKAPDDATYQRGRRLLARDRRHFNRRTHLWT